MYTQLNSTEFWQGRKGAAEAYTRAENPYIKVVCMGMLVQIRDDEYCTDLLSIAQAALEGTLDYSGLHGSYKLVILDKQSGAYLFWGDNAGSQFFFIDHAAATFSDSLLALKRMKGKDAKPCYEAAAQLFAMGRSITGETLLSGVKVTDPNKVYRMRNGKVETLDKALPAFGEMDPNADLSRVMDALLAMAGKRQCCAIVTGGTDSRVVLAHLFNRGQRPKLLLSGRNDNPDIATAQNVADALGLPLTVIDPNDKSADWLERAFRFGDGIYEPVSAYRQLQMQEWAQKNGIAVEFGGVGGEFYKNYFCKPFRYRLPGNHLTAEKLYAQLMQPMSRAPAWAGEPLSAAYASAKERLKPLITERMERGALRTYNHVGYRILQSGYGCISNNTAPACVKLDPLLDRDVVAGVSFANPIALSMHIWQRREIAANCPRLSELPTDQGYSCSLRPQRLFAERCKKLLFWVSRVNAHLVARLGGKYIDSTLRYWDKDFCDAQATEQFSEALATCKRLGVVADETKPADIPPANVGHILLIGTLFSLEKE